MAAASLLARPSSRRFLYFPLFHTVTINLLNLVEDDLDLDSDYTVFLCGLRFLFTGRLYFGCRIMIARPSSRQFSYSPFFRLRITHRHDINCKCNPKLVFCILPDVCHHEHDYDSETPARTSLWTYFLSMQSAICQLLVFCLAVAGLQLGHIRSQAQMFLLRLKLHTLRIFP